MKAATSLSLTLTLLLAACNLPGPPASEPPAPTSKIPLIINQPVPAPISGDVIDPASLEYLGAFRLPEGGERPYTFAYGGNGMTFNPAGDPNGAEDGFPGSLFISGHDRLPYGELPDGGQVAEVSIPVPVVAESLETLNRAGFLQEFQNVLAGHFTRMDEIPRMGLLYLDTPSTGPVIHVAYGQHFEPDPSAPTHGWFSPDLSRPAFEGEWFLEGASFYSITDYMLEIPTEWANAYVHGQVVGTGRFRDGGWSGMGPTLIAYLPWDENGYPQPAGTSLATTPLLLYEDSYASENFDHALRGYQHPDEWNGGAWLTASSGKSAVLFAGTKSNGYKFWYGYVNPAGSEFPCVDEEIVDFVTCRTSDGGSCPSNADFEECPDHSDYRGWWSTHFDAEFIFYDPADLARVASGTRSTWEPQPYAVLDIDEHLFLNPSEVETDMLGSGDQRRYRIGDVAFDRTNGLLYILELFADGAAPVVHIWKIR